MKAKVVYEKEEKYDLHVGPYGYERVGVLIEDRVIWLSCTGYGSITTANEYEKWEGIAKNIVEGLEGTE